MYHQRHHLQSSIWTAHQRVNRHISTGTTKIYYAPDTPITNTNVTEPNVQVGTANNQVARSTSTDKTAILQLVHTFPTTGHIMPTFNHTLIRIGTIYDADCTVTL